MRQKFLTLLSVAVVLGHVSIARACLCTPFECFSCWNAIITPWPVIDAPSLVTGSQKVASDTSAAVGAQLEAFAKKKVQEAKSSVMDNLSAFPVADTTLTQPFSDAGEITSNLTAGLLPQSDTLTKEKDENAAIASAKGEGRIDEIMIQVERAVLSTNATLEGEVYEKKKRAYMRQENAIDAYAKALLINANLDELVDTMDSEINEMTQTGDDLNAAYRGNMAVTSINSQLYSLLQQVLASRLQLTAARKLDQVGTLRRPVIQKAFSSEE